MFFFNPKDPLLVVVDFCDMFLLWKLIMAYDSKLRSMLFRDRVCPKGVDLCMSRHSKYLIKHMHVYTIYIYICLNINFDLLDQ